MTDVCIQGIGEWIQTRRWRGTLEAPDCPYGGGKVELSNDLWPYNTNLRINKELVKRFQYAAEVDAENEETSGDDLTTEWWN